MLVIPAIDLRGGRCVRLFQGDYDQETSYHDDPVAVARQFAELGATWLHVVDLDGAKAGYPAQLNLVHQITGAGMQVELGGGLRTIEDVSAALGAGVDRVILGTAAIDNPELMSNSVEKFGSDRVVLGVDARDGKVAVRGWLDTSEVLAVDLIRTAQASGIWRVIYTDIDRDGTLASPNYAQVATVAKLGIPVIASGGVGTKEHLEQLASIPGVEAAIVGRAIYDGTVTFASADDWRISAKA